MPMSDLQSRQLGILGTTKLKRRTVDVSTWNDHATDKPCHTRFLHGDGTDRRIGRLKPAITGRHGSGFMVGFNPQRTTDKLPPPAPGMGVTIGDGPNRKGDFVDPQRPVLAGDIHRMTGQNARPRHHIRRDQEPDIACRVAHGCNTCRVPVIGITNSPPMCGNNLRHLTVKRVVHDAQEHHLTFPACPGNST